MFEKILLIIVIILEAAGTWLLKKVNNASDKFFEKKAENLATKQDIAEITRATENVQDEFKRSFSEFEQDLKYQHILYETQYKELYSNLFYLICQSEALRFVEKQINPKLRLDFQECPVVEMQSSTSIMDRIIELVDKSIAYASPGLILLCTAYRYTNELKTEPERIKTAKSLLDLKKEIVTTIIRDYIALRGKLKLQNQIDASIVQETAFEALRQNEAQNKEP